MLGDLILQVSENAEKVC